MRVTRLKKQPPARRQVAITHAEMPNDVVSMNVNFWKLKEHHKSEKKRVTVLNIVDTASGMHIASIIPYHTSLTLWKTFVHGWARWARAPKCLRVVPHRAQISKEFFEQA